MASGNKEYFFTDYDCDIDGVSKVLEEYENVRELNYLGHVLDEMSEDHQTGKFESILDAEGAGSIKDLINLAGNIDSYYVVPDITTEHELGEHLVDEGYIEVPDHLLGYIDYEAIGRDAVLEGGSLTDYGYVEGVICQKYTTDKISRRNTILIRLHLARR